MTHHAETQSTAKPLSPYDLRHPETAATLLLMVVVLATSDDGQRFPIWPEAWGMAPPLNSILVLAFLALAVRQIARYSAQAASNIRNAG